MKVNNELISPIQVQRGVQQGCPVSGFLFALAIEPRLCILRENISGLNCFPRSPSLKISAYADDICVIVRNRQDITALTEFLRTFFLASSLQVNWKKSKALWVPHLKNCLPVVTPPPSLSENLEWNTEGVAYLGVFLGSTQFMKKNWEDTTEEIRKKLNRWGIPCQVHMPSRH